MYSNNSLHLHFYNLIFYYFIKLTFPHTKYSSTSSTDKYVLKYKYQVQVLYLTPTLLCYRKITNAYNNVKLHVVLMGNNA